MKLVSFFLPTPMGPQIRTGGIDAAGGIVDLAGAFRAALLREGLTPGAAERVSEPALEQRLAGHLGASYSSVTRSFVCRELAIIGSAASLPELAPLLVDDELSVYARNALEGRERQQCAWPSLTRR